MQVVRRKIFNLIREDDENTISGTIFDTVIIVFIVLNVSLIIVDTFHPPAWFTLVSGVAEVFFVAVFTLEYLLRIWTAPLLYPDKKPVVACLTYMFSFMAFVDLLSILPVYFPMVFPVNLAVLRSIRMFRLLRIFKIGRYTNSFNAITYVFKKKIHQLLSSVMILFVLLLIAAVIMYEIEYPAQPDKFDNALSSFWWAVATVTTLGYGDLYPITVAGKLLGIVIVLLGIGLVAVPTGIISAGFVEAIGVDDQIQKKKSDREKKEISKIAEKNYCPHCGRKHE